MNLADLIETGQKSLSELEKRMAAKPSAALAEKLGKEALEANSARIEERIARLERQRAEVIARLDGALEAERAALADARRMAEAVPSPAAQQKPKAAGEPATAPAKAAVTSAPAVKPKKQAAKTKPPAKAKPAVKTRPAAKNKPAAKPAGPR